MIQNRSRLATLARAAAITLALGGAGFAALPAQAQSPNFGFSIRFGNGFGPRYPERIMCMTDYQVRQSVAARGYSRIYLNAGDGKYIQVKASRAGQTYLLKFNRCTDRIVERVRLRR